MLFCCINQQSSFFVLKFTKAIVISYVCCGYMVVMVTLWFVRSMFTLWLLCLLYGCYCYPMVDMSILWLLCLYYGSYVYIMVAMLTLRMLCWHYGCYGALFFANMVAMVTLWLLCLHYGCYGYRCGWVCD